MIKSLFLQLYAARLLTSGSGAARDAFKAAVSDLCGLIGSMFAMTFAVIITFVRPADSDGMLILLRPPALLGMVVLSVVVWAAIRKTYAQYQYQADTAIPQMRLSVARVIRVAVFIQVPVFALLIGTILAKVHLNV